MGKIKTPDWILKGSKKPSEKKKGRMYKIRKCPKCGSAKVNVVLGEEEGKGKGEWECKQCKWKGTDISMEEVSEEEFMKHTGGE
jgi:transcription elongation factor Elf1